MSNKLRDLIRLVRACKTQAEERESIAKECAAIRTSMKTADNVQRHQNVAKLLFIHMLGYPTHFGQVECLKLIASGTFSQKRIGYLGLMAMVDERHEVLMLVTNSIKQDMNSNNQYTAGLALCALGNLASPEMSRDLQVEVEKVLKSSQNAYIQKKAFLVALRSIRKVPDLLTAYLPYVKQSITEKNPSIVLVGLALAMEMIQIKPKLRKKFAKYVETLVKFLKNLITSGYSPDRDCGGINDPFLQVRIIRFLCIVGEGNAETSEQMNDVLAQVATNTEPSKNPGNAILYECVRTVMSIEAESGLRVMAVNILGRFLLNRDNNIRYIALNTLCQCVKQNVQAIQRHRNTIVECLKDVDQSIRARALDLIYCLVNTSNVESLVHELVSYLQVPTNEKDFRADLTSRVTEVVERYAPSPKWHIDTLVQVLQNAGNLTKLKVPFRLAMLITDNPDVRAYAVFRLFGLLTDDISQTHLVLVSLWAVGEFGSLLTSNDGLTSANQQISNSEMFSIANDDQILDRVGRCLKHAPGPPSLIKQYCLMTILKLSSRLNVESLPRCQSLLSPYTTSIFSELQSRACEFSNFMKSEFSQLQGPVLAAMPTVVKRDIVADQFVNVPELGETVESKPEEKAEIVSQTPSAFDLLGLDLGVQTAPIQGSAVDLLADIFGTSSPTPTTQSSVMSFDPLGFDSPIPLPKATFGDIEIFNNASIRVVFAFEPVKCPGGQFRINASFFNNGTDEIHQFEFKAAVPKYIRIRLNAASGSVLKSDSPITQQIEVMNTTVEKPLLMKFKIDGVSNASGALSESGQVNNFPPGL
uniref:AP-1 complex subunit gamma n=1 Tax=Spongospora subterranea TaxID=70186 RepID=A0A0H5R7R8_9EUKA|eukprot:CRZ10220.1 hypothetical protein [Spongospora subterranea]